MFLKHEDSVKAKFSRHGYNHMPRTVVGNDVWIGHGAKVRAGVRIGHGAVIGMGAVVTRDVGPYSVVAGNPARELRRRFDEGTIELLLKSAWWDFDDHHLTEAAKNFPDPKAFIRAEKLA
ncbi:acetyltransferase [Sphingosinicella humi]|uniref:Acetyltransferase n=1 Tax=Allosphingosinicella humi TaxID=2068657 RepID=A0A2U2J180_9SPHN|nr:acetyltransferase [Sphingosinicella humi]